MWVCSNVMIDDPNILCPLEICGETSCYLTSRFENSPACGVRYAWYLLQLGRVAEQLYSQYQSPLRFLSDLDLCGAPQLASNTSQLRKSLRDKSLGIMQPAIIHTTHGAPTTSSVRSPGTSHRSHNTNLDRNLRRTNFKVTCGLNRINDSDTTHKTHIGKCVFTQARLTAGRATITRLQSSVLVVRARLNCYIPYKWRVAGGCFSVTYGRSSSGPVS